MSDTPPRPAANENFLLINAFAAITRTEHRAAVACPAFISVVQDELAVAFAAITQRAPGDRGMLAP